jgi:hypothetical protein
MARKYARRAEWGWKEVSPRAALMFISKIGKDLTVQCRGLVSSENLTFVRQQMKGVGIARRGMLLRRKDIQEMSY